jgi:SNF2 family DNA or RNA helicase
MNSYDTDWNPHADLQAQDRYVTILLWRLG